MKLPWIKRRSKRLNDYVAETILDDDDQEEELINISQKGFTPKLASATLDIRFFKRLFHVMNFSGTTFLSVPHLCIWLIIGFSVVYGVLIGETGVWQGDVITHLSGRNYTEVASILPIGLAEYASIGLIDGLLDLLKLLLAWYWRKNITNFISKKFLDDTNPFTIVYLKQFSLDNPDQRIVKDIDLFCSSLSKFVVISFQALAVLVYVTYTFSQVGWKQLLIVYSLALFFAIFYFMLVKPLAKYTFKQNQVEGDFRYAHARVRDYAESIALYKGEDMERKNAEAALDNVILNQRSVAKWTALFSVYNQFNRYLPQLTLTIANGYILWNDPTITDDDTLSTLYIVGVSLGASLMETFAKLISLAADVSVISGNLGRIAQLSEMTDYLSDSSERRKPKFNYTNDTIEFVDVTCTTPQNTVLVNNLNLKITEGTSVLIMGPSGAGKSSLLRSLVGLWYCEGTIRRPRNLGADGIFFLPQKPYLTFGTLREQIIYPHSIPVHDDSFLLQCLQLANLDYIHSQRGGWDTIVQWREILSPGEQQRLSMARLFYHSPKFAILDESTSALDSTNERRVYEQCMKLGITLLSVAHRPALMEYHNKLLKFDGKGGYKVIDITSKDKSILSKDENWDIVEEKKGTLNLKSPEILDVEDDEVVEAVTKSAFGRTNYLVASFKLWKKMHRDGCRSRSTLLLFLLLLAGFVLSVGLATWPYILEPLLTKYLQRDQEGFLQWVFFLVFALLSLALLIPGGQVSALFLGIRYRRSLTKFLHNEYFNRDCILQLNTIHKEIDNVDQRLATETNEVSSGFEESPGIPFILYYANITILSPIIQYIILLSDDFGGGVPFLIILGTTAGATLVSLAFMHFIAKYTFIKSKTEGDFRYNYIQVREHAEAIGFHGDDGIERERIIINQSFDKLLRATTKYIISTVSFSCFTNTIIQISTPLSMLIIMNVLQNKNLEGYSQADLFGTINQMKTLIVGCFTVSISFINILKPIAQHRGYVTRINQLLDKMVYINGNSVGKAGNKENRKEGRAISFDNVVCVTPTGRALNQHGINVSITTRDRLILMGPSGCGKSSLLRVLSGLWPLRKGEIIAPKDVFFVPQKPYMVLGTLRDQVIYPHTTNNPIITIPSDDKLAQYLKMANLEYLLSRFNFDSIEIWNAVLSPGEQQRLSLARLFYHTPSFAALDESTSALDPSNEDAMYKQCEALKIGIISVGHRESLTRYHNMLLMYDGNGGWSLKKKSQEIDDL
eukprot:TRINITY_DN5097_c1_g2_i2.p1 TRINITY_DN5097_c1_g2~~TRINITY_DN5097_c1_g2_i2.p1  ORF type:complete len:1244 (-),score=197.46 TRINITY_DN5097_c1_g2_i2:64-3795(-)